jgi:hypothetical protein
MSDNLTVMIESIPNGGRIFDFGLEGWRGTGLVDWQMSGLFIIAMIMVVIGIAAITFGLVRYFKQRRRRNVQST